MDRGEALWEGLWVTLLVCVTEGEMVGDVVGVRQEDVVRERVGEAEVEGVLLGVLDTVDVVEEEDVGD